MKKEPQAWVVDASVVVKLFLPESHSEETQRFFELSMGEERARLYVPDLLYIECANILWKYTQRFGYSPREAQKAIESLKRLGLKSVSTAVLMERALELSTRWGITAYDASYLALAEQLKAPLLTADERLSKKVKNGPLSVRWIGDLT